MKLRQKKLLVSMVCLLSLIFLAGSASANLVVNGGFETGDNTGFFSDYTYVNFASNSGTGYPASSLWKEASYAVGTNPANYHVYWGPGFTAQSGEYMMIINGATSSGEKVWAETNITVVPNTTYYFSFWIASIYPVSPAELAFSINGAQIGPTIHASTTVGDWQQFYVPWNSGALTSVELASINLNLAASGNDFALDNIVFDTNPVPLPPTALLLGTGLLGLVGWRRFRKG